MTEPDSNNFLLSGRIARRPHISDKVQFITIENVIQGRKAFISVTAFPADRVDFSGYAEGDIVKVAGRVCVRPQERGSSHFEIQLVAKKAELQEKKGHADPPAQPTDDNSDIPF